VNLEIADQQSGQCFRPRLPKTVKSTHIANIQIVAKHRPENHLIFLAGVENRALIGQVKVRDRSKLDTKYAEVSAGISKGKTMYSFSWPFSRMA
jgi:hypothetical protein